LILIKLTLKLLVNEGSLLNNLEIEAKNVEVAINSEDLELKIAIFKIKNFARFLIDKEFLRLSNKMFITKIKTPKNNR
jgi:predicted transport protein